MDDDDLESQKIDEYSRSQMVDWQIERAEHLFQVEAWAWENYRQSADRADLLPMIQGLRERAAAAELIVLDRHVLDASIN
jgi:hypothetical protein